MIGLVSSAVFQKFLFKLFVLIQRDPDLTKSLLLDLPDPLPGHRTPRRPTVGGELAVRPALAKLERERAHR
jgi:hypothetical protein